MYCLSFDCATKSLAFVIAKVNISQQSIQNAISKLSDCTTIEQLKQIKLDLIHIIDGEMVDLFPNIHDTDIKTVDRIKALVFYVRNRILPELDKLKELKKEESKKEESKKEESIKLKIFIEFQMSANPKARMIFAALIAIFADYDVILVNPSLKNKIYLAEEGKHKHFIKKYSQLYSANKAHAKYNFMLIEKIFGSPQSIANSSNTNKGHIADAFMQILPVLAGSR